MNKTGEKNRDFPSGGLARLFEHNQLIGISSTSGKVAGDST